LNRCVAKKGIISLPEKCLKGSRFQKYVINIVEVREICVNFKNPIRLDYNNSDNIDDVSLPAHERLRFHPSNDIVEAPGHVEEDCSHREIPAVDGCMVEDECAVENAENQLIIRLAIFYTHDWNHG
jgi:hypothetical protein